MKSKTDEIQTSVLQTLTDFKQLEPVLLDERFRDPLLKEIGLLTETQVKALLGVEMRREIRKSFTTIHREMDEQLEKGIRKNVEEVYGKEREAEEGKIMRVVAEALGGSAVGSGVGSGVGRSSGVGSRAASSSAEGRRGSSEVPIVADEDGNHDGADAVNDPANKSHSGGVLGEDGIYRPRRNSDSEIDEALHTAAFQENRLSDPEVFGFQSVVREFVARTVLGALTAEDGGALTAEDGASFAGSLHLRPASRPLREDGGEPAMPRFTAILTQRLSDLEKQLSTLKSELEVYPPRNAAEDVAFLVGSLQDVQTTVQEVSLQEVSFREGGGFGNSVEQVIDIGLEKIPRNPPGGPSLAFALSTAGDFLQRNRSPVAAAPSSRPRLAEPHNRRGSDPGPFRELLQESNTFRKFAQFQRAKASRRAFSATTLSDPVWDDLRVENLEKEVAGLRRGIQAVLEVADMQFDELGVEVSGGEAEVLPDGGEPGALQSGLSAMFKVGMKTVGGKGLLPEEGEEGAATARSSSVDGEEGEIGEEYETESLRHDVGLTLTSQHQQLQDACLKEAEQLMQESLAWFADTMLAPLKEAVEQLQVQVGEGRVSQSAPGLDDSTKHAFGLETAVDSVSGVPGDAEKNKPATKELRGLAKLQGRLSDTVSGMERMASLSSAGAGGLQKTGPFVTTEDFAAVVCCIEDIVDRMDLAFSQERNETKAELSQQAETQNAILGQVEQDLQKLIGALGGGGLRGRETGAGGSRDGSPFDGPPLAVDTAALAREVAEERKAGGARGRKNSSYHTSAELLAGRLKRRVQSLMVEKSLVFALEEPPRGGRESRTERPTAGGEEPASALAAGMQNVEKKRTDTRAAPESGSSETVRTDGTEIDEQNDVATKGGVDPTVAAKESELAARPLVQPGYLLEHSTLPGRSVTFDPALSPASRALSPNSRAAATFNDDIVLLMQEVEQRVCESILHNALPTVLAQNRVALREQLETVLREKLTSEVVNLGEQLTEIEGRVAGAARGADQKIGVLAGQVDGQLEEVRRDMDWMLGQIREQLSSQSRAGKDFSKNFPASINELSASLVEGSSPTGPPQGVRSPTGGLGLAAASPPKPRSSLASAFTSQLGQEAPGKDSLFDELCRDSSFKLLLQRMEYGEEKGRALQTAVRRVEEQLNEAMAAAARAAAAREAAERAAFEQRAGKKQSGGIAGEVVAPVAGDDRDAPFAQRETSVGTGTGWLIRGSDTFLLPPAQDPCHTVNLS